MRLLPRDGTGGATPRPSDGTAPRSFSAPARPAAGTQPDASMDERRYARRGWWVVLIGVAGFLGWAAIAPLDKGVPVQGTVKVAGNRKALQAPVAGLVGRILVRDGAVVRPGDALLQLDDTAARASADALHRQWLHARSAEARLEAERDGLPAPMFPAELAQASSASIGQEEAAARAASAVALQRQLFTSRRQAFLNEIDAMQEAIVARNAELAGLRETRQARSQQVDALREQAGGLQALARDGYVPRNRLLETERLLAQANGALAEDAGRIGQLLSQVAEQKLRIVQRREERQAEVRSQLAETRLAAGPLADRLRAAEFELAHTVVRAPVAGTVVGLAVFTEGGYVRAGDTLMEIVPTDLPLVVEAQAPVHLIDTLHAGLPVELLFPAFNQNRTPRIAAEVKVVGADRLVDARSGVPYYPLQIEVTAEGMRALAGLDLRAGMPAEAFVRTGERTLLSYLFKPLMDRAHVALSEE